MMPMPSLPRVCCARYELIFGHGYVSTGGEVTTKEFVAKLGLKHGDKVTRVVHRVCLDFASNVALRACGCGAGGGHARIPSLRHAFVETVIYMYTGLERRVGGGRHRVDCSLTVCVGQVLDVGCGIGGGNFYMAREYGAEVLGIDLSQNMLAIAHEREAENGACRVMPIRGASLGVALAVCVWFGSRQLRTAVAEWVRGRVSTSPRCKHLVSHGDRRSWVLLCASWPACAV